MQPVMTNWIRLYSTQGSSLSKPEVEKRIIDVFKAFDKVSFFAYDYLFD
jgi:hypothetical protein